VSLILARALAAAALAAVLHACGESERAERSATPAILPSFAQQRTNADASPPEIPYSPDTPRWLATVARRWPHDSMAYTQGLLVHDGRLLESTGVEGRSDVREVERVSGRVLRRTNLAGSEFGEGIAVLGDRLYQLTWKSGRGRIYDARTLAPADSFSYEGEGWGLASDGQLLYLSDGTSRVRVIDPRGFRVRRTIQVSEVGKPIYMLNELEWVRGELWANVYETSFIARIDPITGHVLGWIDLSRVLRERDRARVTARGGVANGIAYDSIGRRLLVTGKYWPHLAQLDSVPWDD
jgi:glutamine cyclotransferase